MVCFIKPLLLVVVVVAVVEVVEVVAAVAVVAVVAAAVAVVAVVAALILTLILTLNARLHDATKHATCDKIALNDFNDFDFVTRRTFLHCSDGRHFQFIHKILDLFSNAVDRLLDF